MASILGWTLFVVIGAPNGTDATLSPPAHDRGLFEADLHALTGAPRSPGSAGWRAAQDLCATRLSSLGFAVERHRYATGVNVLGRRQGTVWPEEQIFLSAHYDSVPDCRGADDNASGVAGILAAAEALARGPAPARTLVVACWDEEEAGMVGSMAYLAAARGRGDAIVMGYVFEMIGYRDSRPNTQDIPLGFSVLFPGPSMQVRENESRGDFIMLVSTERDAMQTLSRYAAATALPAISLHIPYDLRRSFIYRALSRSDHWSFWANNYPAMMISDTAEYRNLNYHCGARAPTPGAHADDYGTLDIEFALQVVQATVGAVREDLDF